MKYIATKLFYLHLEVDSHVNENILDINMVFQILASPSCVRLCFCIKQIKNKAVPLLVYQLHIYKAKLRKVSMKVEGMDELPYVLLHVKSGLLDPPHLEEEEGQNYLIIQSKMNPLEPTKSANDREVGFAYPSWSIAMTLNREARASKLRKKKP